MSTFKNKHRGSRTRNTVRSSHSRTRRRSTKITKTLNKQKINKRLFHLDEKFNKLKKMENDVALPKMKAIIEMEVQNNKASMGQAWKLLDLAFKHYKKGEILLGNGYLLTAFAILSISIGGDAPRPGGSQIGGPISIPGLRTAGMSDMYYEWRHIDMDVHELPIGYKQLERKLRRQYFAYKKKLNKKTRKSYIKPNRRTAISTRRRRLKTV